MLIRTLTTLITLTLISVPMSSAKSVSASEQKEAINSTVAKLATESEARCECSWVSKPVAIETGCESPELNVKLKRLRNGTLTAPVEIRCEGVRVKTRWYELSCHAEKLVAIAARKIERNDLITPDSIETKWIPIELSKNAVTNTKEAIGKKARYSIPNGSILWLQVLENPKPVEKGEPLLIVYKDGSLEVSSIAIAQKSGSLGSVIPVLNMESQKVFFARIISKGKAEPLINSGVSDESD